MTAHHPALAADTASGAPATAGWAPRRYLKKT